MTATKPIPAEMRREIEVRAYLIWEREGQPHGRQSEHWRRAEAEILGTVPEKKTARAKSNGTTKVAKPKVANGVAKNAPAPKPATAAKTPAKSKKAAAKPKVPK